MMKKAQQIRTMLPIGLRDVMRVSTTSFSPGALLITLGRDRGRGGVRRRYSAWFGPTAAESPSSASASKNCTCADVQQFNEDPSVQKLWSRTLVVLF